MKSKSKGKNDDEDKVGYGNPPKHSQFQKGQSGNSKGRPKKIKGLKELLDEELQQLMQVEGKSVEIQRLLARSVIRHALKGKQSAMNIVFGHLAGHDPDKGEEDFDPEIDDKIALHQWLAKLGNPQPETSNE